MVLLASALPVMAAVTGVVVREDGTPVANARVTAMRPMSATGWEVMLAEPEKPTATAVTDAKGAFAASVEGRGLVRLRVDADGFAPQDVVVPMDEEAGRIVLRAAPLVEGHVTAGGKPVAGAEVIVVSTDGVPSRYEADAKGIYRVPDPRVWASGIAVRHANYAAATHPPGDRDFVLTSGRAIDGRVFDANDKPVVGARVELDSVAVTTTAADGTFHFAHAPEGAAFVRARSAEGIGMAEGAGSGTTVKLLPQAKIFGVVRDADKHPLANIGVAAIGLEGGDATLTGSDGGFTLVVPRGKYRVADAGDEIFDFVSEANAAGGDVRTDVTATRRPSIDGVVRNMPGSPIPSAWISLICVSGGRESVCAKHVLADDEGRFRLRLPVAAGVTMRAVAVKAGLTVGYSAPLDASTRGLTITLPPGTRVGGRVVTADGHPIAGVAVTPLVGMRSMPPHNGVMSSEGTGGAPLDPWAVTGDDGQFSGRTSTGIMALSFTKEGYIGSEQFVSVAGQAKPIEVTLARDAPVTGRVSRKDGTPPAETPVPVGEATVVTAASLSHGRVVRGRVTDENGQPLGGVIFGNSFDLRNDSLVQSQSGTDGSYEITGLSPDDEFVVGFRKNGFVSVQQWLKAGHDDVTLDVTLRRGVTVRGRVVDRNGVGVAKALVSASSKAPGGVFASAETGQGGEFHIDGLAPARWDFVALGSGKHGAVKDVDVEKVHEVTIKFESLPAGTISGHVSGLDPAWTMPGVIATNLGEIRSADVDAKGNYRIEDVPAGTVDVFAAAEGVGMWRRTKTVSVEIAAGSEMNVDLAYESQVALHGRVTRAGAPIVGVTVRFSYAEGAVPLTDAGGAYSTQVAPGEYDVAVLQGDQELAFSKHVVVSGPAEVNLAIEVATAMVTVVDEVSQPISGAHVSVGTHGRMHTTARAVAGADGKAVVDLRAGEINTLVASSEGYGNVAADLMANGMSSVTIKLARSPGVYLRIVDSRDGRTLYGDVMARDAAGHGLSFTSTPEPNGSMQLRVPPGKYSFSGSSMDYGSATVQAEVPASGEIRIPLPREGALVLRTHGSLHATARLIQPDGEEYVRCWCNGVADITVKGRSTFLDRIAPGSYTLEVTPAGGKPRKYQVTVVEGVTMPVDID